MVEIRGDCFPVVFFHWFEDFRESHEIVRVRSRKLEMESDREKNDKLEGWFEKLILLRKEGI